MHCSIYVVTNLARFNAKEKRDQRRHTRKEGGAHTRGAHHRFERKPHFCVGASAGEVAREVAWTRNGSSATSSLRNLHRKGEARPLVDLATPRKKKRHFESNRRKTRAGKMDNRGYARSFFARRDRARARGKSRRAGSRRARDGYRAARPMRTRFRSRAKERHFFGGGGREFVRRRRRFGSNVR